MGSGCTNLNKKDVVEPNKILSNEKLNSKSDLLSINSSKST